jgi:hypothetical protein
MPHVFSRAPRQTRDRDGRRTLSGSLACTFAVGAVVVLLAQSLRAGEVSAERRGLEAQACEAGDAAACFRAARSDSVRRNEFEKMGMSLCMHLCDSIDVRRCRAIARRWSHEPFPAESLCRSLLLERAVALAQPACDQGDAASCVEIGNIYTHDWLYPNHDIEAANAYARACKLGLRSACDSEKRVRRPARTPLRDRVMGVWGLRYAGPQGPTLSAGFILGRVARAGRAWVPDGRGLLLEAEAGLAAGGVSVGYARVAREEGWATLGYGMRLGILRAWDTRGPLRKGTSYYGGELGASLLVLNVRLGYYFGGGASTNGFVSWGIGIGF